MAYWLYYSSLDWTAYIVKSNDKPQDYTEWRGPFKTLKEARKHGLALIRNDIGGFQAMRQQILGKPEILD